MRITLLTIVAIFLVIGASGNVIANADILAKSESRQDTLQAKNTVEKIHIHFDRAHYSAGDTMWFKSYLIQRSNQLTENSRVMYIDLINSSGKTIQSTKIPIEAGLGWGHIALDAGLPGGVYRILAYTNWMKNYGEESFFTRTINVSDLTGKRVVLTNRVVNTDNKKIANVTVRNIDGSPVAPTTVKYTITLRGGKLVKGESRTDAQGKLQIPLSDNSADLDLSLDMETGPVVRNFHLPVNDDVFDAQFFPEGGGLVTGLASRIGVKVTGADGLPRDATGYIINQQQSHIASFTTEFGGMGVFGLNPQAGEQYTAVVQTKGNQTQKFTIPVAATSGYVMTISSDSLNFIARIKSSPDKVGSAVTLQVSAGGREIINIREKAVLPQLVVRILKAELPAGISRVTLLSTESLPVAERLIFVDQLNNLSVALAEDRESFSVKSEITSTLKANDASGKPALGSFSLAITDEDRVMHQVESEVTILSNLLLTSEIKGNIENPNYYFISTDENKRRQLDNLLLTQGWRRFNMIAKTGSKRYEAEKGLRVSGKVLTPLNSPAPSSTVNLIVGDGSHGIFSNKTNEKGEFVFDSLYFEGPNTLRLTAANNKGKSNVNLVLDTLIQQRISGRGIQKEYALQQIPDSVILALTDEAEVKHLLRIAQIEKMQLLDEVKVSAQRVNKINESKNINTTPALYTLPEKHFEQYSNMKDALESKIPSLVFKGNLMKFRNDSISIFVDGVPMDADFRVRDINTADVAGLEVLTGAQSALYGRKAILFVTLKTGMTKSSSSMGQASIMVNGYGFNREFYSPRFDKPGQVEAIDYRKTIYWNPNLLTREGLSQEFSFYTGNKPGRYRFVIEGIDEFGNVFRKVFSREIR